MRGIFLQSLLLEEKVAAAQRQTDEVSSHRLRASHRHVHFLRTSDARPYAIRTHRRDGHWPSAYPP